MRLLHQSLPGLKPPDRSWVQTEIERSLHLVQKWVEDRHYKGYDPGDGLTSFVRPLTCGNLLAERILQQAIWKSPVNLRRILGVTPLDSTKGRGFMAWGYAMLYSVTPKEVYRGNAIACLDWLDQAREKGQIGHCWGNHFDFSTRSGCMKAHTPTIVWSGLIGQAFIAAYEQLGDERFLDIAESICKWILTLPRETTASGNCFSYIAAAQNSVHNSNLLGAALLATTGKHRPNREYQFVARDAIEYSCRRQLADGSWWYGEDPKYHWIDSFHTAYNLDSLKRYIDCTNDQSFQSNLSRGYEYFKRVFFEDSGRPRYYHNRAYPIDIQCAAQGIDTFCLFSDEDPAALDLAIKIARWTIAHMQDPSGYFYYREYPLVKARTAYFHWGQATMFKALAHLMAKINQVGSEANKLARSNSPHESRHIDLRPGHSSAE